MAWATQQATTAGSKATPAWLAPPRVLHPAMGAMAWGECQGAWPPLPPWCGPLLQWGCWGKGDQHKVPLVAQQTKPLQPAGLLQNTPQEQRRAVWLGAGGKGNWHVWGACG